ncbi:hypothetical protein [Micromonospora tarensis]|uniref:Uncharacterized protein n=1 Tax=Micromonospora tarensis TaxID=2806100 RepID=A0ABS1YAK9_9ACTN|nr:hypothetical protein [Micromonospora tarensis]MBM0274433.1 hypothetical protein [Micromonospora tarensis]
MLGLLDRLGGRVVELGPAEHDQIAATTQALTHAAVLGFGMALADLAPGAAGAEPRLDLATIAAVGPPPHQTLLALLARISGGTSEVYWDVQHGNPLAGPARAALAATLHRLAALIDRDDSAAFHAELAGIREFFGPHLDEYRKLCARLFAELPTR